MGPTTLRNETCGRRAISERIYKRPEISASALVAAISARVVVPLETSSP